MLNVFGERQQKLLKALLEHKSGLRVEDLSKRLSITRTAVNQHLSALMQGGYVAKDQLIQTGGRPGYTYILTQQGQDLFPKQYAWFSQLLLESLKQQLGGEGLEEFLQKLGSDLSGSLKSRIENLPPEARLKAVAQLMSELGYDAGTGQTDDRYPAINACNCVYHHVAKEHKEVCRFDIALLSSLLDAEIEHTRCMVQGDQQCQFKVVRFKKE